MHWLPTVHIIVNPYMDLCVLPVRPLLRHVDFRCNLQHYGDCLFQWFQGQDHRRWRLDAVASDVKMEVVVKCLCRQGLNIFDIISKVLESFSYAAITSKWRIEMPVIARLVAANERIFYSAPKQILMRPQIAMLM
jgi:hypothetical protein